LILETNAGERHFLAMMDDFSKYAEVHVMTEKSEAKEKAVEILQRWMTHLELTVKKLRSDGGKELTGNLVSDFCKSKGMCSRLHLGTRLNQIGRLRGSIGPSRRRCAVF
jgi:hypothetical protein